MKNKYDKPEICALDQVVFETVCAGSGEVVCPKVGGNRTSIDADKYNPCQGCFVLEYPGFNDDLQARGMAQGLIWGSTSQGSEWTALRASMIREIIAGGGSCPGGLTNIR